MKKQSGWYWYGVKIIKQIIVCGEPDENLVDEFYDDDGKQHFEESVMLVRARSFDHAYKTAENKAKKDNEPYMSIYGQQVTWKFIRAVDCFLIIDELKSGAEVYSCFHLTAKDTTTEDFINTWFDSAEEGCRPARRL